MFTRHIKLINSDITQKNLDQLKLKFRKQFSNQIILTIIKRDHFDILKKKSWLKSSGWYDWTIWAPVFNIIQQAHVQRIYLTNFRNPDIIYNIVHISFIKLRELHLQDNLISSLEPITALEMPCLRKLDLRRNLIFTLRCLKRCDYPFLEELNLSDNLIQSCNDLSEVYLPQLKRLIIEQKTYLNIYIIYQEGRGQRQLKSTSRVNGYDMKWILKLQTTKMQYIKYAADDRIIRKQLQQLMGVKYYKLRVEKKGMEMGSLLPLIAF